MCDKRCFYNSFYSWVPRLFFCINVCPLCGLLLLCLAHILIITSSTLAIHIPSVFLFVCFFIREKKDLTVGEMALPLPGVNVYEHSLLYGQLGQAAAELLDCWLVHESNEQIYPTLSRR